MRMAHRSLGTEKLYWGCRVSQLWNFIFCFVLFLSLLSSILFSWSLIISSFVSITNNYHLSVIMFVLYLNSLFCLVPCRFFVCLLV